MGEGRRGLGGASVIMKIRFLVVRATSFLRNRKRVGRGKSVQRACGELDNRYVLVCKILFVMVS